MGDSESKLPQFPEYAWLGIQGICKQLFLALESYLLRQIMVSFYYSQCTDNSVYTAYAEIQV